MTSWTQRITYVKQVVESIMNNTVQPDKVYLNLSKTEFEGINLPQDLVDYFNSDERLIINWVSGPNTKAMKKIFPILQYLNDDDILFPKDLIESRLNDFERNGRKYCITSNTHTSVGFGGKMKVVSAMSLFQKKMLNHWQEFVTQAIVDTNNDDRTYLHLIWLNGFLNRGCTKWNIFILLEQYDMKLDNPISKKNSDFKGGLIYDRIAQKEFNRISNKNVIDSFGFWK